MKSRPPVHHNTWEPAPVDPGRSALRHTQLLSTGSSVYRVVHEQDPKVINSNRGCTPWRVQQRVVALVSTTRIALEEPFDDLKNTNWSPCAFERYFHATELEALREYVRVQRSRHDALRVELNNLQNAIEWGRQKIQLASTHVPAAPAGKATS